MPAVCDRRVPEGSSVRTGLSSAALKCTALLCMTADHIAFLFIPFGSVLWCVLRFAGRLAMPIFCFQLAEGCAHTHDLNGYMKRLILLAVLSQLPFSWMCGGGTLQSFLPFSVAVTLLCGGVAVWTLQMVRSVPVRVSVVVLCALAACLADWGAIGVLWIVTFWYFRANRRRQMLAYLLLSLGYFLSQLWLTSADERLPVLFVTAGLFAAPLFFCLYNGRRGQGRLFARVVYLYYPVHMALLTGLYVWLYR